MRLLRRFFPLPFLPLILAPFILLAPVYLTGKALFWGTPALQFVPWQSWAWQALRSGSLPLWNPLLGMGAPLAANYQSALFYPPNLFSLLTYLLGGVSWMAWGMALLVAFHLALAGIGTALLVRDLGVDVLGQTISGLAFALSGYLVARASFLSINAACAWLPWILFAALRTSRPGFNWKPFLFLSLLIGLQLLAGHAQTAWYSLLLAGVWTGYWGWREKTDPRQPSGERPTRGWRGMLAAWGKLALAVLAGAALAAIQLLPTAEYLVQSQRVGEVDYELAMTYSLWPWRLLSFLAPDLFGNPAQGNYWGYGNYWENALYIGVLPLLLALSAALGVFRKKSPSSPARQGIQGKPAAHYSNERGLIILLLAVLGGGILLALGKFTPLFPWLYRHIPTFDMFQAPARYLIWVELALVLLAGLGAQVWRRPRGRALYWTRLGAAGAAAITIGAGLTWYLVSKAGLLPEIAMTFIRAAAWLGLWGVLAGLLSLTAPPVQENAQQQEPGARQLPAQKFWSEGRWTWAVILVVMANMLASGWGLNPGVPLDFYSEANPTGAEVLRMAGTGRLYLPNADEESLKFERFLRFDRFDPGENWSSLRRVLLPNLTMLEGIESVNNFDPLVPGRFARWMEALDGLNVEQRLPWLNLMGVSVVEREYASHANGVDLLSIQELPVSGRVRWVPCAKYVQNAEASWEAVWSARLPFDEQVILETEETIPAVECDPHVRGDAALLNSSPNAVTMRSRAPAPGWVVLSDTVYPGWRAWVDGKRAQILPANYLLRGIPVPAGEHTVHLAYQPFSFWAGALISLAAVLILAGVFLRKSRG